MDGKSKGKNRLKLFGLKAEVNAEDLTAYRLKCLSLNSFIPPISVYEFSPNPSAFSGSQPEHISGGFQ
jgi:hypothetical protein